MREETTGPGCRVCGAGLAVAERGRPPSYCSRGCQAKAYRQRKRDQALDHVARETREERGRDPETSARRRREIAGAVWRIASAHGLDAVSMRGVAAEAGVSLRVVQYYFGSKHHLLTEALRLLNEENERRARERMARLPDPAGPREALRAVLDEFLPLDDERRAALRVLVAYYVRDLADPALAAVFPYDDQSMEKLAATLIRQAGQEAPTASRPEGATEGPVTVTGRDAEREADLLVSGVSGLGRDVLHGRRTMDDVHRTVEYHLDRIFGPASAA